MKSPSRRRRGRGGQGGHEPSARIRTRALRAIELSTLGWSQHRIAAEIGVSQPAVSKILKRADAAILRELLDAAERQKVRHTLRLEHLFAEALRAWEASKADTTRRRQSRAHDAQGRPGAIVAEVVVDQHHGDPRYLEEARKALADHRKLWGLDAPHKLDIRASRNPYDDLTEDALRDELARQARLLEAGQTGVDVSHPQATVEPTSEESSDVDRH
jgi:predicted transcriptional regulator